jgi:hypothetical protein
MSKRMIGLILNLAVCLGIGFIVGQRFYSVFRNTVPTGCMSDALQLTAHGAYIGLGLMAGGAFFVWSVIAIWMARFFSSARAAGAPTSSAAPTR